MKAMVYPTLTRAAVVSLLALVAIDFILIGIHVSCPVGPWDGSCRLGHEGGLAELVGYLKLSIAAGLLAGMAIRNRAAVLAAWALALLVVVADDALQLHEIWGGALTSEWDLPAVLGLRSQDLGELLVWAGLAALVVPVLALAHHHASDRRARSISWQLMLLAAALAFFAIGADMLGQALMDTAGTPLGVVEEGGELFLPTLILVAVIAAETSDGPAPREKGAGLRE